MSRFGLCFELSWAICILWTEAKCLVCPLLQVYRALRPAVNGEACCALLSCLSKCLASPTLLALDTAVEIVLTLQVSCSRSAALATDLFLRLSADSIIWYAEKGRVKKALMLLHCCQLQLRV